MNAPWIKVILTLLIITAIFSSGCFVTHLYYKNEINLIEDAKNKAIIAQQDANAKLNAVISKETITFIKGSDEIKTVYRDKIVYVRNDKVSTGFVEFYNSVIEKRAPKQLSAEQLNSDSDKTMVDVAAIEEQNLNACNKYIIQLIALQNVNRKMLEAQNKQ